MAVKSFTIYEEYYDLITLLEEEEQKEMIYAIVKYMFNDVMPSLNERQQKIFNNLKRPLDISKNRSKSGSNQNQNEIKSKSNENQKENKLKSNQNQNEIKSKTHQDVNVNVNNNINNIYSYYENIYTRTLNPIEYETMTKWLETKSEDEIKRAIDETAKANIDNIKYVEKVLYGSKKNKKIIPKWFNSEIVSEEDNESDLEFKSFIEDFRNV